MSAPMLLRLPFFLGGCSLPAESVTSRPDPSAMLCCMLLLLLPAAFCTFAVLPVPLSVLMPSSLMPKRLCCMLSAALLLPSVCILSLQLSPHVVGSKFRCVRKKVKEVEVVPGRPVCDAHAQRKVGHLYTS